MNRILKFFIVLIFFITIAASQNVVIAVIDGARYSETFGAEAIYIPNIWNKAAPARNHLDKFSE